MTSTAPKRELTKIMTPYSVDLAIRTDIPYVIAIRFGKEDTSDCVEMDAILQRIAGKVRSFTEIYTVDVEIITEFNEMYELEDDVNLMFFYQNRHIQVDCGSGVHSRVHFPLRNDQEAIDMLEVVFRGAQKGRKKVSTNENYATKQRF